MIHVISTTSHRRQRRQLALAAVSALAALTLLAAASAQAGECPADQRVADGQGQPMSAEGARGVTDKVIGSTDLAREPLAVAGRQFRARRLDVMPGGIVPWHSHGDRPAMILVASGEITEYASTCRQPIVHRAGEVTAERSPTSHWWKNHGRKPVVIYSFDLFHAEDKADEHMM